LYLRAHGHFGGGSTDIQDRWSAGFRIARALGGEFPDVDYLPFLASLQTPFTVFHGSSSVNVGSNCYLTQLSAARVGPDGKYNPATEVTNYHVMAPIAVGNGTPTQEWSNAFVFSLRTARPRGVASNGRVYWPLLAPTVVAGTGRLDSADVTAKIGAFKTLLNAINAAADTLQGGARVCVMSQVGSGATEYVTAVRADGRLDRQERRENQLASNYVVSSIP
jgi:hypothetical protein